MPTKVKPQKKTGRKITRPTTRKATGVAKGTRRPVTLRGTAYDAAGNGRRSKTWQASSAGPNAILAFDADVLRRRSRDLLRQNPWAFSGVESFVSNCVGTGIKPQSRAKDLALRTQIHEAWSYWVDEADADDATDFYGLQSLICRSLVEGGECFVRFRERRPEDGFHVPLQLQVLEAEHVPSNWNMTLPNGNIVRSGIEFDQIGRRVAYWMYRNHPGEFLWNQTSPFGLVNVPVPVPAENVLHIYRPLRPGQIRGEPWMARVLIRLHELDKYDDAVLVKQQTAALFAGFITSPAADLGGVLGAADTDENGLAVAGLEPGILQALLPGQEITFATPPLINGEQDFINHQLRGSAAGMNVPVANMTGDLSGVNYSSIRAGIVEFRRRCEMFIDNILVYKLNRQIWERWLMLGVLAGVIDPRPFLEDRRASSRAIWIGQGWQWVDPLKEVEASLIAMRAGLKSRSQVIAELGEDAELVDETIAADNARADRLNLVFDSDPRKGAKDPTSTVSRRPVTAPEKE
jgi:lambda family phage portal protein